MIGVVMLVGRPKKYGESMASITFYLPQSFLDMINEKSKKKNLSRTELLNALLLEVDIEKASNTAETYNKLKKYVEHLTANNDDCVKKLNKFLGSSLLDGVYKKIEPDERTRMAFEAVKDKFWEIKKEHPEFPNTEKQVEYWVGQVYEKLQDIMTDEGYIIDKEKIAKQKIKLLLLEKSKQTTLKTD